MAMRGGNSGAAAELDGLAINRAIRGFPARSGWKMERCVKFKCRVERKPVDPTGARLNVSSTRMPKSKRFYFRSMCSPRPSHFAFTVPQSEGVRSASNLKCAQENCRRRCLDTSSRTSDDPRVCGSE